MSEIVLASASPVRAFLLRSAGISFTADPADVDEPAAKAEMQTCGAEPSAVATRLADLKALTVSRRRPDWIVGADQTLEFRGELVDKPRTIGEARAQLEALRGRRHRLHAAVAVARDGEVVWRTCESASLTMRRFSAAFLDAYIASEGRRILASVGGYRLEGPGAQLFSTIRGDYFAILGLPLLPLLEALRLRGALIH